MSQMNIVRRKRKDDKVIKINDAAKWKLFNFSGISTEHCNNCSNNNSNSNSNSSISI